MKENQLFDNSGGKLQIKNRSLLHWLVVVVSFWPFLMKLTGMLPGALGYLKYLPDGILVVLLVLAIRHSNMGVRRYLLKPLLVSGGFLLYTLLVYLFQYQSVAYYLWGFRNNFRFYIAFFAFIAYLDQDDVTMWFSGAEVLFWVNAVLSLYQFLFRGLYGDFLGGIFGTEGASNGYTMLLLIVVVSKSVLQMFNQREEFWVFAAKCATAFLIAIMAELKAFYILFVLILLVASGLTRYSGKKLALLLCGAVLLMLGVSVFSAWYESAEILSLENLWDLAIKDSYSEQTDVNRLSAIATLTRSVITRPLDQIFGFGLGNCDTSAFAVCNTPFFQQYGYMHYTWFTAAMIFLETGYIGIGFYFLFVCVCMVRAYKMTKSGVGVLLYNQLAIVMGAVCFALFFYNSSLRIESGYMVYFILALPFMNLVPDRKPVKGVMVSK